MAIDRSRCVDDCNIVRWHELAGASAAALLIRVLSFAALWIRYRFLSATTVELHGGNSLTLVIQHKGLPVKVRARAIFMEFGEDMESHPAPYDLHYLYGSMVDVTS